MKFRREITNGLVILILLVGSGFNCTKASHKPPATATTQKKSYGPPPHAPAHGYRAKTSDGIEVVYDSKLGVYVVVDLSSHYFYKGFYYRFNGHGWEVSAHFHDSWKVVAEYKVPPNLRSSKRGKGKGKHKS